MKIKFGLRVIKISKVDYEELIKIKNVEEQYEELNKKFNINVLSINVSEELKDGSGYNVYYFDADENYLKEKGNGVQSKNKEFSKNKDSRSVVRSGFNYHSRGNKQWKDGNTEGY